MLHAVLCYVLALVVYPVSGSDLTDYKHNENLKGSYKFYSDLNWFEAFAQCARDGGALAYPSHALEARFMSGLADHRWKIDIFVGANDIYQPKRFRTIEGILIDDLYHPWYSGEPKYESKSNCIVMSEVGTEPRFFFYDDDCNRKHDAICWIIDNDAKTNATMKPVTMQIPEAKGYRFEESLGAYYKPYYYVSWFDAFAKCSQDGAALAYPRHEEEARYLHGLRNNSVIFLGATDLFQEGSFRTIEGELLHGYPPWNYNEPNNLGEEDCVVLMERRTMVINDALCANRLDAVCRFIVDGDTTSGSKGTISEQHLIEAISEQHLIEATSETASLLSSDGYTYNAKYKASYMAYSDVNWYKAFEICSRDGATLAYPRHEEEARFIYNLAASDGRKHLTYLGATDFYERGAFQTIDGVSINEVFHQWIEGSPHVKDNEHCIVLANVGELSITNLRLNVIECALHNDAVCWKLDIDSDIPSRGAAQTQMTTAPEQIPSLHIILGYVYIESLDAYYKPYHRVTWYEAFSKCSVDGASLAYPRNELEALYISGFTESHAVFLGATDFYEEGVFRTLDGKLIRDLYHPWSNGEPNNIGEEDCLEIMRGRRKELNDVPCTNRQDAVCRILPVSSRSVLDLANSTSVDFKYNAELRASYMRCSNLSWFEAFAKCESSGATLAYPRNEAEASYMFSLTIGDGNAHGIHLGATDLYQKETFRSTEGELLTHLYQLWIKDEQSEKDKNCLTLVNIGDHIRPESYNLKTSKSSCHDRREAVCRKLDEGITNPTSEYALIMISADAGYKLEDRLDSYYKPYYNVSWYEAFEKCSKDGAVLVYPQDEAEALHLYTLSRTHRVFIGATDFYREGTFRTIKGLSVNENYHAWNIGEPDDKPGADCVALTNIAVSTTTTHEPPRIRWVSALCSERLDAVCSLPAHRVRLVPSLRHTLPSPVSPLANLTAVPGKVNKIENGKVGPADLILTWCLAAAALPALAVGVFCCYRARRGISSARSPQPAPIFRQLNGPRAGFIRAPHGDEEHQQDAPQTEPLANGDGSGQHQEFVNILGMRS